MGYSDRNDTIRAAVAQTFNELIEEFRAIGIPYPYLVTVEHNEFRIYTGDNPHRDMAAYFCMSELPGCCGVVCFHNSYVYTQYRGKGLGRLLLRLRQKAAILAGYTLAMATTIETNGVEQNLLFKEGWATVDNFKNKRTENSVFVLTKKL